MIGRTLFDKIWDVHVVESFDDGWVLLHIDRHLLHDLSGPPAVVELRRRGFGIREPMTVFATPDHLVATAPNRTIETSELGHAMWNTLMEQSATDGMRTLGVGDGQGIVHVVGPEQGVVMPGLTVVCGDSHTCTNGALGAVAFGIGNSQSTQALATGMLLQQHPRQMRITIDGDLPSRVTAKDVALALIAELGAAAGAGYAVEYAGPTVTAMDVEARMTLCNLTVELGAKFGLVAPDDATIDWVRGRKYVPSGSDLDEAIEAWRRLYSDDDASFDREVRFDASALRPMITWGTSPEHAVPIDEPIPALAQATTDEQASAWQAALSYMHLEPGTPVIGTPVDWVFIGSCANARLGDLRAAADIVRGRRVAPGVSAWVVPGSEQVRAAAEAEHIDTVFADAGFEWRQAGCSMCVAANGDRVPPGARCVSTSNRNFVGRQGPGARTHLASPITAAAAAVTGVITDPRELLA
jgi:3-isopropylmalate/(R)-2-methylmalate dehydratase large subunit